VTPLEADDVLAEPVVAIAGLPVRLGATDSVRGHAVAALFRHADLTDASPCASIVFAAPDIAVPTDPPSTSVDGVDFWRPAPGELVLRSREGLSAHVTPGGIVVGGEAPFIAAAFRFVGFLAVTHFLAQHGRHVIHAGAVLADAEAVLVLGATGTGKSTLVFSALQAGWPALADDAIALHERDGRILAEGLPRPISVPLDIAAELAGGRAVPDDRRERTELLLPALTSGAHPVAGVVVAAHGDDDDATLERLDGHATLRALMGANTSLADPALVRDVFRIGAAVARLPAWMLAHGNVAATRVERAARQLAIVRAELRTARTART
jgi:hypothetical protein